MNKTFYTSLAFVTLCCVTFLAQGCKDNHNHAPAQKNEGAQDTHASLHQPKQNGLFAEFPGHEYAMEIVVDEQEPTGLVTAFLTDAHFNPLKKNVDAQEVRLNFVINGLSKPFTLTLVEQEAGKPAVFTLTDKELATLHHNGPYEGATATVEIGGVPYSAPLKQASGHDDHHGHAH